MQSQKDQVIQGPNSIRSLLNSRNSARQSQIQEHNAYIDNKINENNKNSNQTINTDNQQDLEIQEQCLKYRESDEKFVMKKNKQIEKQNKIFLDGMQKDIQDLQEWRKQENKKLQKKIKCNLLDNHLNESTQKIEEEQKEIENKNEQEDKESDELMYWLRIQNEQTQLQRQVKNIFYSKQDNQSALLDNQLEKVQQKLEKNKDQNILYEKEKENDKNEKEEYNQLEKDLIQQQDLLLNLQNEIDFNINYKQQQNNQNYKYQEQNSSSSGNVQQNFQIDINENLDEIDKELQELEDLFKQ